LLSSDKPLSPQERKLILAQAAIGFRILQENKYPLPVCLAVLEHQERMDGSGYPRHITGEKISLYGRIIAVAASYTAAVSKRPFKSGLDGHSGIMDLLKDIGKRYDDRILRSLVFTLSIFPPGTFIALSNGAQGVVVKTNPENPKYRS
jgi:HD-GYP domain-containing protein (c-di-GMP phosphodiesterase class II)